MISDFWYPASRPSPLMEAPCHENNKQVQPISPSVFLEELTESAKILSWEEEHTRPLSTPNWNMLPITKTRLYNFDPLKSHFYIVKLGFTGVYIIFVISDQNIGCGYSLELPHWGSSKEYPQSMFWAETWKISEFFYPKIFIFLS